MHTIPAFCPPAEHKLGVIVASYTVYLCVPVSYLARTIFFAHKTVLVEPQLLAGYAAVSVRHFVCRDTQTYRWRFDIDPTPPLIIDTIEMSVLLLVESPLHPLTLGQTCLLNHPQRRELKALKEVGSLDEVREEASELQRAAVTS